jgi:hypothetical protein
VKRPTPPRYLTEAFRTAGLSWYLHGDQAPDQVLRLHDGGPACWLAQFDHLDRPCSGELEVFHFIGRQRIRNILRQVLATDLWADGAIDPIDNHLTPALEVPLDALPVQAIDFICDWGFDLEAERAFSASQAGAAAGFQQQPLAGAGAENREGQSVPCSSETRSTLSAGSGESSKAGGGACPADPGAAAVSPGSGGAR